MKITCSITKGDHHCPCFYVNLCLFDKGIEVGKLKGVGILSSEINPLDAFEAGDEHGIDFDLLRQVHDKNLFDMDVLFLNEMVINESHRGKGYGISLIKRAIQRFCDKTLMDRVNVLMHPCPLAWPDKETRIEGEKALSNYYAKHFPIKRIKRNSPYFYFTVDSAQSI